MSIVGKEDELAFAGTSWVVAALRGRAPLPKTTITLEFVSDSKAGGSSGCNNYTTSYKVKGDRIHFGRTTGTLKACPEPVMAQEQAYLQALAEAAVYQVKGEALGLIDDEGTMLVQFTLVSQALSSTSWRVTGYNNGKGGVVSVISGTELSADFDKDGRVSGSSGCNTYRGGYRAEGGRISIGSLAGTRKMCAGEGVMEQEALFLQAMETAAVYKISGRSLELRREDGALAVKMTTPR